MDTLYTGTLRELCEIILIKYSLQVSMAVMSFLYDCHIHYSNGCYAPKKSKEDIVKHSQNIIPTCETTYTLTVGNKKMSSF